MIPCRENENAKIVLVQLTNRNLGDTVIADNARYLVCKAMPWLKKDKITIIDQPFSSSDFGVFPYADAIVFVGGGIIKFQRERLYEYVINIVNAAQEYNIPVFFNGVGVEGYDENDERCLALKEAINLPCVKGISVRDDIDILLEKYIENPDIKVTSVFDPAVWSGEVYKPSVNKTDEIGLCIARDKLFTDYGTPEIDRDFLLEFWKNTALEIEKRGRKWKIFTNGLGADESFAHEVLAYIGHGEKLSRPSDGEQLIEQITSFSSIIACRMHTNIIAYTFSVPSIALVWIDKLRFWGEKIGYSHRFIEPENMSPENVVDCVLRAEKDGCKGITGKQRNSTLKAMKWFMRRYAKPMSTEYDHTDFSKKLVAAAMGSEKHRYKEMNCLEAFKHSLEKGYRNFEVDVRLTSDNVPVCVNGWLDKTYTQLGVPPEHRDSNGLTAEEFLKLRYEERYDTCTFEQFSLALKEAEDRADKVILDLGKPNAEKLTVLSEQIDSIVTRHAIDKNKFIIRLLRVKDIALMKERLPDYEFACYYGGEDDESLSGLVKIVNFCEKNNIELVTMKPSVFDEKVARLLEDNGLSACVLSCVGAGSLLRVIELGAAMAGSYFYDVSSLTDFTK